MSLKSQMNTCSCTLISVVLYALLLGSLPFSQPGNHQLSHRFIFENVARGFGTRRHRCEMASLSQPARLLITKCLMTDSKQRIAAAQLIVDPWIINDNPMHQSMMQRNIHLQEQLHFGHPDVMRDVKCYLKMPKASNQRLLSHILKRPFGSTAGLYRLVEMEKTHLQRFKTPSRIPSKKSRKSVRFISPPPNSKTIASKLRFQ